MKIITFPLASYQEVWQLQKELQAALLARQGQEALIVCQHQPVITCGKSFQVTNLLSNQEHLRQEGIDLFEVERGGDVTYHGPGQLVIYPIIDLNNRRTDVAWYMHTLEEIALRLLGHFGLQAKRSPGRIGVWVDSQPPHSAAKIASLGVKISHWCTMHGLAINVKREGLTGFKHIHPCGLKGVLMTSIESELGKTVNLIEAYNKTISLSQELLAANALGEN